MNVHHWDRSSPPPRSTPDLVRFQRLLASTVLLPGEDETAGEAQARRWPAAIRLLLISGGSLGLWTLINLAVQAMQAA